MLSIVVDLHRLRQSLRIAAVALSRHVAAFGAEKRRDTHRTVNQAVIQGHFLATKTTRRGSLPVVILVHQVVPGPERHKPGIVRGSWNRDRPRTADVGVTQLVRQQLEFVCGKTVVVPQDLVVGGPAGSLRRTEERSAAEHQQTLQWHLKAVPSVSALKSECHAGTELMRLYGCQTMLQGDNDKDLVPQPEHGRAEPLPEFLRGYRGKSQTQKDA